MKKGWQILLTLIGIILILTACSNEKAAEPDMSAVSSNPGIGDENKGGQSAPVDSPAMLEADKEKPVAEKDKLGNEAPLEVESVDSYPSADEISAALEDEKGTIYWLAPTLTVPDVCLTLNAETVNLQALWDTIHERVFENANLTVKEMPDGSSYTNYQFNWKNQSWELEIGDISIGLRCDAGLDENVRDSTLNVLTEQTGMGVSFVTGDPDHYAFTCNGLTLDEGGYSLSAEEWIPETTVSLDGDSISICYPLMIQGDGETIRTESFIDMDSVREIYKAYWTASGLSAVPVITGVELVYYFRDGQLLPAWRLTGQIYFSANGHDFAALLDAVTGEIIRDT